MRFDIITLFPEGLTPYFGVSILKRAEEQGLIEIVTHQLRDYAYDKHRTVDDTPYGGGAGMVLKAEPIALALEKVKSSMAVSKTRTILLSAKGKVLTQRDVERLATYERLILVCGRYEGVDERVTQSMIDEELSIGEYVLTGGEVPSMVVVDAIARLVPGVLGNSESIVTESHAVLGVLEGPQYTKPEEWRGMRVPDVLLSGHHEAIAQWRDEMSSRSRTATQDPEMQ